MGRTPPLWATVPLGFVMGAFAGTILASLWLNFALREGVDAFNMLGVWQYPGWVRAANPEAFRIAYGAVAATAFALMGLVAALTFHRPSTEYGAAAWQTRRDLKANDMLGRIGSGFVCGKLGLPRSKAPFVLSKAVPHVMMVAPTRAGKGVGFVIPNLLSFDGSMVVLDVKGENFEKTARWRMKRGDAIWRFSPFDWSNATHRYNPLARIAELPSFAAQFTEVSILGDLFLDKDNRHNDTFAEAGKSIFVAACLLAIQRGTPTLGAVNQIVGRGEEKREQYRAYAAEAKEPPVAQLWINAASASERLLTSNIQALMTAGLKQWDNPAVRSATEVSDFDFASFRRRPQSLYIAVSEDHISTLAPLLRLMFADLIASIRAKEPGPEEKWPVMIMIDEFQQMGAMPYLERAIHTLASYGGRVAMIAQSLAALDRIYGPGGRESLENGAGLKLYITPRDQRTVREVSQAVGKTTREAVTRSYLGRHRSIFGPKSQSVRAEERPLLSETEARMMDPDEVVVLAPPQQPIRVKRIKHYEDRLFAPMMEAQAELPLPYPPLQALDAGIHHGASSGRGAGGG